METTNDNYNDNYNDNCNDNYNDNYNDNHNDNHNDNQDEIFVLFENVKTAFPGLDEETIWAVMMSFPFNERWDTYVLEKLLELSGTIKPSDLTQFEDNGNSTSDDLIDFNNDDDNTVKVGTTKYTRTGGKLKLRKKQNDEGYDWDEFDKNFGFDKDSSSNSLGVNVNRLMSRVSQFFTGEPKEKTDYYEMAELNKKDN
jgi:hypothetical protein